VVPTGLTGVPGIDPVAAPPSPAPTAPAWSMAPAGAGAPAAVVPPGPDAGDVARETIQTFTTTTRTLLSGLDPTGWRPTLIVAGVLIAIVLGTQLLNAIIPVPGARPGVNPGTGPRPVPGGQVQVTPNVRFTLAPGWQVTRQFTDELPGVAVQKGDVFMEVRATAGPASGDAATLLEQFRQILAGQLAGFGSTQPTPYGTGGLNGLRLQYQGTNQNGNVQEGLMVVVVSPSQTGILAHAGGQRGSLEPLSNEIGAMVGSLEAR
jgi:hypothetical protein